MRTRCASLRLDTPEAGDVFVLRRADTYLLFAPSAGVIAEGNAATVARVQAARARGAARRVAPPAIRSFPPREITIVPCARCALRCVYCPNRIERWTEALIDPAFVRRACRIVARHAAAAGGEAYRASFHGSGEPTLDWDRFTACVEAAEAVAAEAGVRCEKMVCTSGQLEEWQAECLAASFQEVQVSIDGAPDVHRALRPRADGGDSWTPAVRTARVVSASGLIPKINVTVTADTAGRMAELTELMAAEVGRCTMNFDALCPVRGLPPGAGRAPEAERFVEGFAAAMEAGKRRGVAVAHASINVGALLRDEPPHLPMCILPGGCVIAFYDFSGGLGESKLDGVYGRDDPAADSIRWDEERLREFARAPFPAACGRCACARICNGAGALRGRMSSWEEAAGNACRTYVGVLALLLERRLRGPGPTAAAAPDRAEHRGACVP